MLNPLAKAELVDSTVDNLTIVIVFAGIALAAGILAMVPVLVARARDHRFGDALVAMALTWAVIATISVGRWILDQMKYQREHQIEFASGYFDPREMSSAPPLPVFSWSLLSAGYAGLLGWAIARSNKK